VELRGRTLTPTGVIEGTLHLADGRVASIRPGAPGPRAAASPIYLPGFVDLHVHGGGGADVMDGPEGVQAVGAFHLGHGTTALCPTTVTRPIEELREVLRGLEELGEMGAGGLTHARLLGAHLEGPFLAPDRLGAQPPHALTPDAATLTELLDAGPVAVMTLAPELPGALDLVALLAERGVRASLGHSACDHSQAVAAFAAGAQGVTHLFNAMSGLHHRRPGLAAAALEQPNAYLELILDGHHVHPALFRLALRAASGQLCLVSDAIRAAGLREGQSELGGQRVTVSGGRATLADGTLAGSLLTLDRSLALAIEAGVPWEEASALLSRNPADALGRPDLGRLTPGARADVLELDPDDLSLRRVFLGGVEVPAAESASP
jgi:N-acetylglucosamine-6-phosphate deacetylase